MAALSPTPKQQIFGSDGAPLVGGKIYTYLAGTTTPTATYTDSSAGTANTNPIILDSYGQANIWLLSTVIYKFVVKTATDVLLYTVDNIATPLDISALASPPPIGSTTPNTGAFTTLSASGAVTLTGLGAMKLNAGTTADRPTPSNGMIRYNTSTALIEAYIGSAWKSLIPDGSAVTSVATGTGLTGGPITTTGTIAIDSTVATLTGAQTLTNKTLGSGLVAGASYLTSATVQTPVGGTSLDFTSIPSWVKRISIVYNGVNFASGFAPMVRIGNTAVITTGYTATGMDLRVTASYATSTTGFIQTGGTINNAMYGVATLVLLTGNTWVFSSNLNTSVNENFISGSGSLVLTSALDRVRITSAAGTATFNAGSINILYE